MSKPTSRRNFLKNTSLAGMGIITAGSILEACSTANKVTTGTSPFKTGFTQQPLAYAYNGLEPWIDAQTMDIHYNKHAAAYSKSLAEAAQAEGVDTGKPLEEVLAKISKYSTKMRNNGGGHYNHEMFWKCMAPTSKPGTGGQPKGTLLAAIEKSFNTFDAFKNQFADAGKTRFGSGWAWLIRNKDGNLQICSTPNQDNPLMDIADVKGFPLLGLDVWEHAYYLKYQNKRADYIDSFWKVVNWDYVQQRFAQ